MVESQVTRQAERRRLQLWADTAPWWAKETLTAAAVTPLLPTDWKAMAWVDAVLEFGNLWCATDTLRLLNG